jgi:hypothetical protein
MVIRVMAKDYLDLADFDEVFRTVLDGHGLRSSFHAHGQEFPLPDGPITMGMDGGYVGAAHKAG